MPRLAHWRAVHRSTCPAPAGGAQQRAVGEQRLRGNALALLAQFARAGIEKARIAVELVGRGAGGCGKGIKPLQRHQPRAIDAAPLRRDGGKGAVGLIGGAGPEQRVHPRIGIVWRERGAPGGLDGGLVGIVHRPAAPGGLGHGIGIGAAQGPQRQSIARAAWIGQRRLPIEIGHRGAHVATTARANLAIERTFGIATQALFLGETRISQQEAGIV